MGEEANDAEIDDQREQDRRQGTEYEPRPRRVGSGTYTMTGNAKSGTLDAEQTTGPQTGRPTTMATDKGNYLLILKRQP